MKLLRPLSALSTLSRRPRKSTRQSALLLALMLVASSLAVVSCGDGKGSSNDRQPPPSEGPRLADLPPGVFERLQDPPTEAEAPLARSARAVVKIERPSGILGSGFFVEDGRTLITNAHVLGPEACFAQGCTVRLHMRHFRGSTDAESRWVTLVPYAYRPSLDLAVFRTAPSGPATQAYVHPERLLLATSDEGEALSRGQSVALAGHPSGHLLKIASGTLALAGTPFLSSELLTLPGTSGGPLLDAAGKVIGLHHRGTQNLNYLRNSGYFGVSLSTRASLLPREWASDERRSGLSAFASRDKVTQEDDLERYAEATATSPQAPPAVATLGTTSRAEALWTLCNKSSSSGEDTLSEESRAPFCQLAAALLDCSARAAQDTKQLGAPLECPDAATRAVWRERFIKTGKASIGSNTIFWMVQAPLALEDDASVAGAAQTLVGEWLAVNGPKEGRLLPVEDAAIAMDVLSSAVVGNDNYKSAFEQFRQVPQYYFEYQAFLRGLFVLGRDGELGATSVEATLASVRADPQAALGDVLLADHLRWRLETVLQNPIRGARTDSPYRLP